MVTDPNGFERFLDKRGQSKFIVMFVRRKMTIALFILCICTVVLKSCGTAKHQLHPAGETITMSGKAHASWYGPDFHGRKTASGETYDMYGFSCAHRVLDFGTRVRITYLKTDKSVILTVNDRGPFVKGRDFDLSYAAAKAIGLYIDGVGEVLYEVLDAPATRSDYQCYTIQVGSFSKQENSRLLCLSLEKQGHQATISETILNGVQYYRVLCGVFKEQDDAIALRNQLKSAGHSSAFISTIRCDE